MNKAIEKLITFDVKKLSLGQLADRCYEINSRRREISKDVQALEEAEKSIKKHFIDTLDVQDTTGVSGRKGKVTILVDRVPTVQDWDSLYKYIQKSKRYDFLQRRVNAAAVKEMWEDNKAVPGVGVFNAKKVSLTKVG